MSAWVAVVGIGEDGLAGLAGEARAAVEAADVLVGGERHHDKVPGFEGLRIDWRDGLDAAFDRIAEQKGRRVVVLASGDPMFYGIGTGLARRFGAADLRVIPSPGAFSLAASRMAWPLAETECLTVHGRPVEKVNLHLAPGARLLVLSRDGDTPARVAELLANKGFGDSPMTVLERMGGGDEARLEGFAGTWTYGRTADLNTIAVECRAGEGAKYWPRVPGLPEEAFEHDGRITKREVRAATLAALAPLPGERLWDVGTGSGAVAIEWLRARDGLSAVAVERDEGKCAMIARNAANLGVPDLRIVEGAAPEALNDLGGRPDAVFIGGGASKRAILEAGWRALGPGGRMVANAVTVEAQTMVSTFASETGGDLVRFSVARSGPVGRMTGLRPFMDVLQLIAVKS